MTAIAVASVLILVAWVVLIWALIALGSAACEGDEMTAEARRRETDRETGVWQAPRIPSPRQPDHDRLDEPYDQAAVADLDLWAKEMNNR